MIAKIAEDGSASSKANKFPAFHIKFDLLIFLECVGFYRSVGTTNNSNEQISFNKDQFVDVKCSFA